MKFPRLERMGLAMHSADTLAGRTTRHGSKSGTKHKLDQTLTMFLPGKGRQQLLRREGNRFARGKMAKPKQPEEDPVVEDVDSDDSDDSDDDGPPDRE